MLPWVVGCAGARAFSGLAVALDQQVGVLLLAALVPALVGVDAVFSAGVAELASRCRLRTERDRVRDLISGCWLCRAQVHSGAAADGGSEGSSFRPSSALPPIPWFDGYPGRSGGTTHLGPMQVEPAAQGQVEFSQG
jgi:hypothetical protein